MYYLFTYFLYLYTAFLGPKTKRLYKITILFEEQILNEADQKGRLFAVMQNKHKTLFYNFYKNIKVIKQGGKKRAGHNLKWKYVESTSLGENERSVISSCNIPQKPLKYNPPKPASCPEFPKPLHAFCSLPFKTLYPFYHGLELVR